MSLSTDNPTGQKSGQGILSFSCPESLIRQLEKAANEKNLTISEYMIRLIQEFFLKNDNQTIVQDLPAPAVDHPLIQTLYENRDRLNNPNKAYEFFLIEFPDIIEKMKLTAILMRKTEYNEFVIQDLISSLIPEPFDPIALQAILDAYQVTAQKLDQAILAADQLKAESGSELFKRNV